MAPGQVQPGDGGDCGLHMGKGWVVSDEDTIQDGFWVHMRDPAQTYQSTPPDLPLTPALDHLSSPFWPLSPTHNRESSLFSILCEFLGHTIFTILPNSYILFPFH